MYYQLQAPNTAALKAAYWEAEFSGLDPYYLDDNVFDLGTGNIEKVTSLISKYSLDILVESEHQPTGYAFRRYT